MTRELTLIILLIMIFFILFLIPKTNIRRQTTQKLTTKTVIKCIKCDYSETRDFKKGDYILKIEGTCPKCNSPVYIEAIYAEVQKTPKQHKI